MCYGSGVGGVGGIAYICGLIDCEMRRNRRYALPKRQRPRRSRGGALKGIGVLLAVMLIAGIVALATSLNSKKEAAEPAYAEARLVDTIATGEGTAGGAAIPSGVGGGDLTEVGIPASMTSAMKEYDGFTVSFNAGNHTPNYVVWELLSSETSGASSRAKEKFWQDESVAGCPDPSDYTRSGYDRGHLYPAADAKWSPESMQECFTMANMTPQAPELNRGAWKTLEEKERLWAGRDGRLIIVAGPVYADDDTKRIGSTGVRVPSSYFKVLLAPDVDEPRAIGFIYPNAHCPGNMQNYAVSVDEVEDATGLDLFPALPDALEDRIEAAYSFKTWDRAGY